MVQKVETSRCDVSDAEVRCPYPLTFRASCALKRFENLWNVPSFMFVTGFSLLGWFYWSQDAAKTRAFRATRSIWEVLTGASQLQGRATRSRIGTAITPAAVLR